MLPDCSPLVCIHCQAILQRGTAPFAIRRDDYDLVLHHVPAWVCAQCGEPYFEESKVAAIQGILRKLDERVADLGNASTSAAV